MAFKKKSMNNYKTNSNREHCAIITAVLQDSLIMPLLLVRHLKAVPQTKIKKQKHSIPLHLEGTNVLPALCLLNYLFFFFPPSKKITFWKQTHHNIYRNIYHLPSLFLLSHQFHCFVALEKQLGEIYSHLNLAEMYARERL